MIPLCERTVIAGKYRLERELASGGMGAVWVARHLQLDELVAIKFMNTTLPEPRDARARFAREARAAARLRGPHVVEVLDHGVDGDLPYLVMELLSGEHLGDRLKRERRLPLRNAAEIADQVGRALGRAHRAGIVHRDLKPANIFLARVDDEEIVKLLDFGIAKALRDPGEDATGTDVLMGSPQYMSPEQARGSRSLDHRADLWSLGAILFRAVTGVPVFDGASAVDVIIQICTSKPPAASAAAPGLPPLLDGFFHRALARDPASRFASAREMTDAFEALVDRIEATPPAEVGTSDAPHASPLPDPSPPALSPSPGQSPPAATAEGDETEGQTFVMDRRAGAGPAGMRARLIAASAGEIDALVERAFGVLASDAMPTSEEVEIVPPTTRCARVSDAPAGLVSIGSGSFGEGAGSRPPTSPSLFQGISGLRPLQADPEGRGPAEGAISILIEQGFRALRRGEADSARRAWQEALALDPSNRMLALNLRRLDAMSASSAGR